MYMLDFIKADPKTLVKVYKCPTVLANRGHDENTNQLNWNYEPVKISHNGSIEK